MLMLETALTAWTLIKAIITVQYKKKRKKKKAATAFCPESSWVERSTIGKLVSAEAAAWSMQRARQTEIRVTGSNWSLS